GQKYIAPARYRYDPVSDLKWVIPGVDPDPTGCCQGVFRLNLDNFETEQNGGWYFYLYVKSMVGASENNFSVRTGPPGQARPFNVNEQNAFPWTSGGTNVYAKRAYPMNTAVGAEWDVYMTQVPANAAGQVLHVRHFDNDAGGADIHYYLGRTMADCGALADAYPATSGPNCILAASGSLAGGNRWHPNDPNGDAYADEVQLPAKDTAEFTNAFDTADSALLMARYTTFTQDTSVWELVYVWPRLIE
ncbi:MAG: hypothetical protein ACRDI2_25385, partial [Chloroflexota bacterium]